MEGMCTIPLWAHKPVPDVSDFAHSHGTRALETPPPSYTLQEVWGSLQLLVPIVHSDQSVSLFRLKSRVSGVAPGDPHKRSCVWGT